MKNRVTFVTNVILIIICLIGTQVLIAGQSVQDSTNTANGNLLLEITGLGNNKGTVRIALSDSKEDYNTRGQAFRTGIATIKNKNTTWTFENIPFGEYAIKTYHDENENEKLDTNFLGIPNEDYGFSNNAKGSFGPASWEDAKFLFENDSLQIKIKIE